MTQATKAGLVRGIHRWDLVAIAINGIIGAGIFGLPARVYALIGPYSLLAFVACALVVALIVLCFAEVGSRFSATGGPYLYGRAAFGPMVGFEVGWLMWLARLTAFAANANLMVSYLGFFWPGATAGGWRAAILTAAVALLTLVNVIGVRDAARFSNAFTVGKLLPLLLFAGAGMFFLEPQAFTLTAAPGLSDFSKSVLLLIYAFTGFEMAVIPAGEARDPRRDLPRAILMAIGAVAVIYISIQVVCIGTLPELAASERPLADASNRFLGPLGASLITVGALVSIVGNLSVLILAGSRLPFAMAARDELPGLLALTHPRFRTPHWAILATAGVMLGLTLSGTFIYAATISAIARLLAYAVTCAALIALRRRTDTAPALFRAPFGVAAAILALALSGWLLSHSTLVEARDAAIAAALGLLIYLAYQKRGALGMRRGA